MQSTMVIGLVFCCAGAWADYARGQTDRSATRKDTPAPTKAKILLLHHSTGECIWNGGVEAWFDAYNKTNHTEYRIAEQNFPKSEPYGWSNYPYDYWNIWVRHAGDKPYKTEPTLEMLTREYDVIVFKHCFPVSAIEPDTGQPDVAGEDKRVENYKLQYAALKKKLREFAKTKFILWTGAALVEAETNEAAARRAKTFFDWVRSTWDQPADNIYLWDFRALETEGGLYLKADHASGDSHPNERFSKAVAPLLGRRIVDVICGAGDTASITGKGGKEPVTRKTETPTTAQAKTETAQPKPTTPQPAPKLGPDTWVFDDAEDPQRETRLWGKGAAYAKDAKGHVIKMQFAGGDERDWGEYGLQRIITTKRPERNHDIAQYRYVALRVRSDRKMELVVTLITRPDSLPRTDESYFGFTAYLHPKAGEWQWIALDLTKLELGAEGEKAYAAAGEPARPEHLTCMKFVTNKANEDADFAVDDIAFYRVLPESLAGKVQAP
ncbi:MAG TPA: hypothetical protein VMZ31_02685 [Phycisphaerae bacterium]|nr:hypothetical protein [Phycisphaerae bacterium]